jgi:hypothetical protein
MSINASKMSDPPSLAAGAGPGSLQRSSRERYFSPTRGPVAIAEKTKPGSRPGFALSLRRYTATACFLTPASAASASALSVFSQVNSGSSRPKCPYAAVFS